MDPVRFMTNRATGTLGICIAKEGLRRGHRLTCIAGPIEKPSLRGTRWVNVVSAREMEKEVRHVFPKVDVVVMSAAVSDYRVRKIPSQKLKKTRNTLRLILKKNPDVLRQLGVRKGKRILVGFALETDALFKNALQKLKEKKLDLIVANPLDQTNNPFGDHRVSASFLWKDGRRKTLRRVSKQKIAGALLDAIEELLAEERQKERPAR